MIINCLDKDWIGFPESRNFEDISQFEKFLKKYLSFNHNFFRKVKKGEKQSFLMVDYNNKKFKIKNFIGEIIFKGVTFHIFPFVFDLNDIKKNEEEQLELFAINLNLYLKEYFSFKSLKVDCYFKNKNSYFLELLIKIFIYELENILKNKPLHIYIEKNDDLLKKQGRIDFNKYLNNYVNGKKHILSCNYELFSFDNLINQILKFVILKLLKISKDEYNKSHLKRLVSFYEEVSDLDTHNINNLFSKIRFNSLNKEYKSILDFAKILLNSFNKNGETKQNIISSSNNNFCFLFEINILYEKFISNKLYEYLNNKKEFLNLVNIPQSNEAKLFKNSSSYSLKPDNLIRRTTDNKNILIIDTKYKDEEKNPSNEDIYQMTVYSFFYKVNNVILLYPLKNNYKEDLNNLYSLELNVNEDSYSDLNDPKISIYHVPLIFKKEDILNNDFSLLFHYFRNIFEKSLI